MENSHDIHITKEQEENMAKGIAKIFDDATKELREKIVWERERMMKEYMREAEQRAREHAANVRTDRKLEMAGVDFKAHPLVTDDELISLVEHPERLEEIKKRIWDSYGVILLAKRRNIYSLPPVEAIRFFRDKKRELAEAMAAQNTEKVYALFEEMKQYGRKT